MKANIFFFVTTIAVVLLTIFLLIVLAYAIAAFRRLGALCEKAEQHIETAGVEVKEIAARIKESFLFSMLFMKKRSKKKEV